MNDQNNTPVADTPKAKGFVTDYRFATPDDIRNLTINHLAKLEAELHTLRMAFVANGMNPNLVIGQGRKLGAEMQKIEQSLVELSEYFRPVLVQQEQ